MPAEHSILTDFFKNSSAEDDDRFISIILELSLNTVTVNVWRKKKKRKRERENVLVNDPWGGFKLVLDSEPRVDRESKKLIYALC